MSVDAIKAAAEGDLYTFARLVNPQRLYGDIHRRVFGWLSEEDTDLNQLLLLPRGHMKSHCLAVWCAWWVTKHPDTTILYISATSTLAEDQLYSIKGMLDTDVYKRYWPNMLEPEEGKRERWAAGGISVDHPARKAEGVRDATIRTAGLTTNTTGWHADIIVPDDVVVPDNAYTAEGRHTTARSMSQMSSIKNAGGMIKACGTRYHPADQYKVWKDQVEVLYDDDDSPIGERAIWDLMEQVVELDGAFLWPRAFRDDGKAFGFNRKVLSRIRAEYIDRTQFYAQYYNDPNDPESNRLSADRFQYIDDRLLQHDGVRWTYNSSALNIYAAIDFAFTLSKKADYTAIVVIGVDQFNNIYVLDIDRFKTDKISVYFDHIIELHDKWAFRKLRAETNVAQVIIARDLKQRIRENGSSLSVDEHRSRGKKEERVAAVLEPRYENLQIWHRKGGHTPALEEELVLARPIHDDIKDALAAVVDIAIRPKRSGKVSNMSNVIPMNSKFGGF